MNRPITKEAYLLGRDNFINIEELVMDLDAESKSRFLMHLAAAGRDRAGPDE